MRGTQEKIGLLATVTQSTVAHCTHLKWFGGSIQKPPLFLRGQRSGC